MKRRVSFNFALLGYINFINCSHVKELQRQSDVYVQVINRQLNSCMTTCLIRTEKRQKQVQNNFEMIPEVWLKKS